LRGGAVRQLVGLITQRSLVQIRPPLLCSRVLESRIPEPFLFGIPWLSLLSDWFWLHFGSTMVVPVCFLIFPVLLQRGNEPMASVYRIRKEETSSGVCYLVDYRDSTGRRTKRRFKKARDVEAFKKQVEASDYTGLPIPRPVPITFASWATEWIAQKEALCRAGKKPRP
jgi:hypothetical protein